MALERNNWFPWDTTQVDLKSPGESSRRDRWKFLECDMVIPYWSCLRRIGKQAWKRPEIGGFIRGPEAKGHDRVLGAGRLQLKIPGRLQLKVNVKLDSAGMFGLTERECVS